MNHDEPNSNLNPLIDPELEARIVAWVAGEASPFEIAELTRLIGEKPELGIFKRRIEAVHGLATDAVRPDKAPLRLSEERRAKLLEALGAPENKSAPTTPPPKVIVPTFAATKQAQRKDRPWLLALAACLTVGLFTTLTFQTLRRSYGNGVPLELPASDSKAKQEPVSFELVSGSPSEAQDRLASKENSERKKSILDKELAYKDTVHRLAESSKDEAEELIAHRSFRSGRVSPSIAPQAPALRHYAAPSAASVGYGLPAQSGSASPAPVATTPHIRGLDSVDLGQGVTGTVAYYAGGKPRDYNYYIHDEKAADKEKHELSPFVVASNDSGYTASNTLAGTRLNTELKDVASEVTVITPQVLKGITAIRMAALRDDEQYEKDPQYADAPKLQTSQSIVVGYEVLSKSTSPAQASAALAEKKSEADRANDEDRPLVPSLPKPAPIAAPVETNASKEPVSTFSLHVSDVSFRLAQAALANNESIDPARIRPEEFYNAFSYGDPTPALAEKVSCRIEQAAHPFLQQRTLVRISTKVAAAGRNAAQPLHLTVLLDTSGSMEREDRAAIVHRAMETLVSLLGPNDRITLIGFARQPSLLAESLPGDQSKQILDVVTHTPSAGGTNLEEALKLGGELAHRQFDPAARNRIVVLTDGAANLGNANAAQLAIAIETLRQQGIAFDACGVGFEGLDDAMLENLTRKGDGRYYVLNSPEAADAGFAHQLAGAFRPAAENVKLQVRFNPARVGNYRLIGFEQHRLREEDFRNDSVDAAELAAEEAAVAVYQIEPLPQGEGELGEVYVRFRDAATGQMVERSWTLSYDPQAPAFDRATPSMQLAGTAALLAEKLHGGQNGDAIKLSDLAPIVTKLRSHYANEPRVQELVTMFEQMRRQAGE